jgi:transcriptional regulator with XRE-family HTH domain
MTQDHSDSSSDGLVEQRVRERIRSLRTARGWTLDDLSSRTLINSSTLSRIETGRRRVALDQLAPIARALGTTIDDLVDVADDEDVIIRPRRDTVHGAVVWPLTRHHDTTGLIVSKMRLPIASGEPDPQVHPGHDWFYVLEGTVHLVLGERRYLVEAGNAAEFSTMTPHWMAGHDGPAEIVTIFDREGERAHLRPSP